MDSYSIEMKDIGKVFESNRTVALDHTNLRVAKGSIHALVGENGAIAKRQQAPQSIALIVS